MQDQTKMKILKCPNIVLVESPPEVVQVRIHSYAMFELAPKRKVSTKKVTAKAKSRSTSTPKTHALNYTRPGSAKHRRSCNTYYDGTRSNIPDYNTMIRNPPKRENRNAETVPLKIIVTKDKPRTGTRPGSEKHRRGITYRSSSNGPAYKKMMRNSPQKRGEVTVPAQNDLFVPEQRDRRNSYRNDNGGDDLFKKLREINPIHEKRRETIPKRNAAIIKEASRKEEAKRAGEVANRVARYVYNGMCLLPVTIIYYYQDTGQYYCSYKIGSTTYKNSFEEKLLHYGNCKSKDACQCWSANRRRHSC